jgi:chlorobactene glucosyltransferase
MLLHFFLLVALVGAMALMLWNLAHFRRLAAAAPPVEGPVVSVLIPARNEVHNIERCVRSVLAQDWPALEIIVLDDRSEDGTGALARSCGRGVRVLDGEPLPEGWVGKNWACHQLAKAARGEWLLFTDADTEHDPGWISALMALARETRADLLSAWPRLITRSLGEALVVPIIIFFGMVLYPHALVVRLQENPARARGWPRRWLRALGAANGQCLLFQRRSYEAIGGHAALRDHLVEDLAFGRAITARLPEGMRLVNCDGVPFSRTRMYRSLGETWAGFTKNARAAFEGNSPGFFAFGALISLLFLLPFAALLLPGASRGFALAEVLLIYTMRGVLAARFHMSWVGAALHPAGLLLAILIGLNSWRHLRGAGVEWKGRRYRSLHQPDAPEN